MQDSKDARLERCNTQKMQHSKDVRLRRCETLKKQLQKQAKTEVDGHYEGGHDRDGESNERRTRQDKQPQTMAITSIHTHRRQIAGIRNWWCWWEWQWRCCWWNVYLQYMYVCLIVIGLRPLHYAAWLGKEKPVELLLQSGSVVNDCALDGATPLHLACEHGHSDVVRTNTRLNLISPTKWGSCPS